jgi:hypothetical protein
MSTNHTHPNDCPDQKDAAADRKRHAEFVAERQRRHQVVAHAEWLEWFPAPTARPSRLRLHLVAAREQEPRSV